jgi:hypothetical protein
MQARRWESLPLRLCAQGDTCQKYCIDIILRADGSVLMHVTKADSLQGHQLAIKQLLFSRAKSHMFVQYCFLKYRAHGLLICHVCFGVVQVMCG